MERSVERIRGERDAAVARADAAEGELNAAGVRIAELESNSGAPSPMQDECALTPVSRCPAGSSIVERPGFPTMVVIPAGRFTMGSPGTEDGRDVDEGPEQEIAIERFALARSEVTFAHWEACLADEGCASNRAPDDNDWGRGARPVINVSWKDAQEFIDWLNSKVGGKPHRLPSEAEWEYAARADEQAAYPWGPDWDAAQANGNSSQTTEAGQYPSKDFGLVDMIGNVWEWTEDCSRRSLSGQPIDGAAVTVGLDADCAHRVVRGGSWGVNPQYLRSANRLGHPRGFRNGNLGFRVARTLLTP